MTALESDQFDIYRNLFRKTINLGKYNNLPS